MPSILSSTSPLEFDLWVGSVSRVAMMCAAGRKTPEADFESIGLLQQYLRAREDWRKKDLASSEHLDPEVRRAFPPVLPRPDLDLSDEHLEQLRLAVDAFLNDMTTENSKTVLETLKELY